MENDNSAIIDRVKEHIIKGEFEKSLNLLSQIEENDLGEKNYYLGVTYANLKEKDKSERHLKEALRINNEHLGAYLTLSEMYSLNKRFDEAHSLLEKAYELDPENFNVLTYLAGLEMYLKNYDKAITLLKNILSNEKLKTSSDYNQHNEKIQVLLIKALETKGEETIKNDKYDETDKYANELIARNEDYAGGYRLLGKKHYVQQNYKEAVDHLIKAFQRRPDDTETTNMLTHALIEVGDVENAKVTNDQVLKLNPSDENALRLKEEVNALLEE
jgi:tetratricopeptide (TPR) repeat protein